MRAKSNAEFINKLKIVEEEAGESQFFLDLLQTIYKDESTKAELERLLNEIDQLLAITVASLKTARTNFNR